MQETVRLVIRGCSVLQSVASSDGEKVDKYLEVSLLHDRTAEGPRIAVSPADLSNWLASAPRLVAWDGLALNGN